MSRWHREHPDYADQGYDPPDFREQADLLRKAQREGSDADADERTVESDEEERE